MTQHGRVDPAWWDSATGQGDAGELRHLGPKPSAWEGTVGAGKEEQQWLEWGVAGSPAMENKVMERRACIMLSGDLLYLMAQRAAAPNPCCVTTGTKRLRCCLCAPRAGDSSPCPQQQMGNPLPIMDLSEAGEKKQERDVPSEAAQRRGEQCGGCCVRSTSPLCLQKEVTGGTREDAGMRQSPGRKPDDFFSQSPSSDLTSRLGANAAQLRASGG